VSSAAWHRLFSVGLLLLAASVPLSKSASNVLLVLLGAAVPLRALRDLEFRAAARRCLRQPLTVALSLYCLVAYAGIAHTTSAAEGFSVANKFVSMPALYLLVSLLLQADPDEGARSRRAISLLLSFLAGLTALNLIGVATFLGLLGGEPFALPLAPLHLHHIWYSNLNALGLYTAAALLLFARRGATAVRNLFLGLFLPLSAACILLSTSRTAWVSVALTAAVLAAVLIRSKKAVVLVVLLALLGAAAAYRFVPLVRDRVDQATGDIALYGENKKAESSVGGRILMWRAALRLYSWHPYVGVGTGDFERSMKVLRRSRLVPAYLLKFNQPHNMYLFAMATNGTAGLAALLYIFYRALRTAVPLLRADGEGRLFGLLAVAAVVHFMIAGCFDSFFNIQVLRYAFILIMGVCLRGGAGGAGAPRQCPPR